MKKEIRFLIVFVLGLLLAWGMGVKSVSAGSPSRVPAGKYTSLEELSHKRLGIITGSSFDQDIAARFPEAEAVYFNNMSDLLTALKGDKIDAFAVDEPVATYIMVDNDDVTYIQDYLDTFEYAYTFPRTESGRKICDQLNEYLRKLKAENALDEKIMKWCSRDESDWVMPDCENLPAPNGVLTMAVNPVYPPFAYVYGEKIVGYDIDIAAEFCEAYGYGLEVKSINFDGILPAVQSGKCDFAGCGITITPERAESILFSEANYSGGIVMAVPGKSQGGGVKGLLSDIAKSFEKTFLREKRWRLFLSGIMETLVITIASVILGTALGFLVYMLCRGGNRLTNGITGFCLWLIRGMPMVVMLMILFYVIFGKVSISGGIVSIIGFTLTFGASVFGLMKMGVGTVDEGQYEAALALGYTDRQTFFKIILPQALPHVMPSYAVEIISLIKATAIVGYIAVQDLTKVGDIVRSRTYEAFFPLIAVTVIYFILEYLFKVLTGKLERYIDPRQQKPENILKGVNTDDTN